MANQPDYEVLRIPLDTPGGLLEKARKVYSPGIPISAVTIVELPAAAVGKVELHFGQQGQGIPLRQEGYVWLRTPPRDDGVFLTIQPGLGGLILIVVVGVAITGLQ